MLNDLPPLIETGTGLGTGTRPFEAGESAARSAALGICHHAVSAVLVYASLQHDLEQVLLGVQAVFGSTLVIGATTAGELSSRIHHDSVVVVALASPYLQVRAAVGRNASGSWQEALDEAIASPELRPIIDASVASSRERIRQGKRLFAIIFSPGNTRSFSSMAFEILEAFKTRTLGRIPIFAGSSADDWRMEGNAVLLGRQVYADSLLVAVFETELSFGIALGHGFHPSAVRMTATAVEGREVLAMDGLRAAEVMAVKLGTTEQKLATQHITLTTGCTFGTVNPMEQYSVNVASYFTPRGGVRLTQPVAVGTELTVMEPAPDTMISAGSEVLRKALLRASTSRPAVVLCHYCALRPRVMGDENAAREVAEMARLVPGTPFAGFCSFGEGGLSDDGVSRQNNASVAVLVLGNEFSGQAHVAHENERLRQELEQARDEALSLLKKIASRLPGVVYQFRLRADGSSCFPFASEALRYLYGVGPEEVREDASKAFALVHPDDYAGIQASIQKSAHELSPWSHEFRVKPEDGTMRWLFGNALPEQEADGAVLWHGFITDISERRQMEDALKAREMELGAIIEAEPECVKQMAADGSLLQMNRAGLGMIEADSLEQVLGQKVQQLVVPEHREAFVALTQSVFAGKSGSLMFEIQGMKGGHRWLETHAVPLQNSQGQITALLGLTRDITERKQMEEQVRQLAFYDPLTQLPNRRLLNDRLRQTLAANRRRGCYGALLFLDLDNFKPLNDTYGHEVGDSLLIEVAGRLMSCMREMDTVARFGGDEFVVILSDLIGDKSESTLQAEIVAEKIRSSLSEPYLLTVKQHGKPDAPIGHHCTASIGVTLFINSETSCDDILKWADTAMYQAKEAGRNSIRFYDSTLSDRDGNGNGRS